MGSNRPVFTPPGLRRILAKPLPLLEVDGTIAVLVHLPQQILAARNTFPVWWSFFGQRPVKWKKWIPIQWSNRNIDTIKTMSVMNQYTLYCHMCSMFDLERLIDLRTFWSNWDLL